jgi:hypothetical protein
MAEAPRRFPPQWRADKITGGYLDKRHTAPKVSVLDTLLLAHLSCPVYCGAAPLWSQRPSDFAPNG